MREKSIAELVTEDFRRAAIFKKHDIDFCCGGKKKLKDVCEQKSLNSELIMDEIAQLNLADKTEDWDTWPLSQLIDHIIEKHHRYVLEQMPIIHAFLAKVAKVHGHAYPEVTGTLQLFESIMRELEGHMMKEENVLFPYIKQLEQEESISASPFGSVENPIRMMEFEHEEAGDIMKHIAKNTSDYTPPPGACNTFKAAYHQLKEFEKDLHQHIHLENNILFPKAIKLEKSTLGI